MYSWSSRLESLTLLLVFQTPAGVRVVKQLTCILRQIIKEELILRWIVLVPLYGRMISRRVQIDSGGQKSVPSACPQRGQRSPDASRSGSLSWAAH